MSLTSRDASFMARALTLARKGLYTTDPNPRVGCVLVNNGRIVGEGFHARAGEPHAEVHALRAAGEHAKGATVYLTLEPCSHHGRTPPCADALIKAGVARAVVAMSDPNPQVAGSGTERVKAAGIHVDVGLMQNEAEKLNPGFIRRMKTGKPFVRVKVAASLDGRTALANGKSQWITSEAARRDVQRWRAQASAILTGVGTVLADDPSLTVRDLDIKRHPARVIVDSRLRTPPTAKLLTLPGQTWIFTVADDRATIESLQTRGARVFVTPNQDGRVGLSACLSELGKQEINEVWVEAGATLCGALVSQNLVDEFVFYYAPALLGSEARAMFALPAFESLERQVRLQVQDRRCVGPDVRVVASARL
jgi:diaminohydroxyphosphoribosylaminopyrimidine deaminase/5-amino-6-(5-phosphoribosylamino)uracil reductase